MNEGEQESSSNGASEDKGMVPSARLREEIAHKRRALGRIGELEQQVAELEKKTASAETLARQLDEVKAAHKRDLAEWNTERALMDAGLADQEGRDIAKYLYSKLPEATRPPMGDWLAAQRADPTKASRSLQPFLPKAAVDGEGVEGEGEAAAPPAKGTAQRAVPPKTTRAADANSAGAAKTEPMSAERLREIRVEAQKTGDWSAWKQATGQKEATAKT